MALLSSWNKSRVQVRLSCDMYLKQEVNKKDIQIFSVDLEYVRGCIDLNFT